MVQEINDENVMQALFDYAFSRPGWDPNALFDKYSNEFPEKDQQLAPQHYQNDFLAWLLMEKPLMPDNKTIAEEFAENTPGLSDEMKKKIAGMKNMIRSKFIVLSRKDDDVNVKDTQSNKTYCVKLVNSQDVRANDAIHGRIHPYGDAYRFGGIFRISRTPILPDMDVMMGMFQNDEINRIEKGLNLHPDSRLSAILNKYPANWIAGICKRMGVTESRKCDKIIAIEEKLLVNLEEIVAALPDKSKEALKVIVDAGGFVKFAKLNAYDCDLVYFWKEDANESAIGALQMRGLIAVGKMNSNGRKFRVALIPLEIREKLGEISFCKNRNSADTPTHAREEAKG